MYRAITIPKTIAYKLLLILVPLCMDQHYSGDSYETYEICFCVETNSILWAIQSHALRMVWENLSYSLYRILF